MISGDDGSRKRARRVQHLDTLATCDAFVEVSLPGSRTAPRVFQRPAPAGSRTPPQCGRAAFQVNFIEMLQHAALRAASRRGGRPSSARDLAPTSPDSLEFALRFQRRRPSGVRRVVE